MHPRAPPSESKRVHPSFIGPPSAGQACALLQKATEDGEGDRRSLFNDLVLHKQSYNSQPITFRELLTGGSEEVRTSAR